MTDPAPPTFAVVGGGISGLTSARAIAKLSPGARVVVLESSDRLGGKLRTEELCGSQVEAGADSFLTRGDVATRLCRDIGIEAELLAPSIFKGAVWDGEGFYGLPPGSVMGLPTGIRSLFRAGALSPIGKLRALADLILPGPLSGTDVSVGAFIRRRFGAEILERLLDPLLAGTRAGNPDEMSLAAALPEVDRVARAGRSVMRGLPRPEVGGPSFLAPRGGMRSIIEGLAASLPDAEIRMKSEVLEVKRSATGFELSLPEGATLAADGVVLAVPASAAAEVISGTSEDAAARLRNISHASVAVVSLAFAAGSLDVPEDSSGFLIPSDRATTLSAATWWSRKWPHTSDGGAFLVRCFVGRSGRHPALDLDDDGLVRAVAGDLGKPLGMRLEPIAAKVTRWDDGLPQYRVGHLGHIEKIESSLADLPGLALTGADYRGSGIPDCILQAEAAAAKVHREVIRGGGKVGG